MKRKYLNIFLLLFLLIFMFSLEWEIRKFGYSPFDQIFFLLLIPSKGTSIDLFLNFIIEALVPALIVFLIIIFGILIINQIYKDKEFIVKKIKIFPINSSSKKIMLTLIFLIFLVLIRGIIYYKIFNFLDTFLEDSDFIANNYVDPKDTKIELPDDKKNLIYIYMESMESTYSSKSLGGDFESNLIPNLSGLGTNNINISDDSNFGGLYQVSGATWTIAGMVAQTSGIPLKIPTNGKKYFKDSESFLNGAYSLGDVLSDNGYNQVFFLGSDASFAGRDYYYKQHGNYEIIDYDSAIEKGKIPSDYYVFWGYEDEKLFEYAKEEVLSLASSDKPFNFTMLTVDTHTYDGYLSDACSDKYDRQIMNVISCSDKMTYEFINWLSKQDFYEDTVIVITGDHLNMDSTFFTGESKRTIFNTIINSSVNSLHIKNRVATSFDMYPTTLAALGADIEGDRLGLGVNLFSNEETLGEQYGIDYLNNELQKTSNYYDYKILENEKN